MILAYVSFRMIALMIVFIVGLIITLFIAIKNRNALKRMDRQIDKLMDNPQELTALIDRMQEVQREIWLSNALKMETLITAFQQNRIAPLSLDRFSTAWLKRIDTHTLLFFVKYGRLNTMTESDNIPVSGEQFDFEPLLLVFSDDGLHLTLKAKADAVQKIKTLRNDFGMTLEMMLKQLS